MNLENDNEKFRWPDQKDAIIEYFQSLDSSSFIINISEMFLSPLNKDVLSTAENIIKFGSYSIPPYGTFKYGDTIDWTDKLIQNRSFMRALHGHFLLNDLIKAFRDTLNVEYIQKGYQMIQDWAFENDISKPADAMAWHDETTAKRLINWIAFFEEARKLLSKYELIFLLEHIQKHVEVLCSDSFYNKNTNHGMFQDLALIVYSDYFFCIEGNKDRKLLACTRLKQYFELIFSPEGVHLEHSPFYHQLIAHNLLKYGNYFKNQNNPFGDYLLEKYNKSAVFATHIIKPDGYLPQIGDTQLIRPSEKLWSENKYYRYAVTSGKEGTTPKLTDIVFPDAGYAIFRDTWANNEGGTYILVTAAYHTDYHKHSDDLNLWIYANGGDIIVESGPHGYNYKDEFTQYTYSSFAHNSLIVDDLGLPRVDGKYGATRIVGSVITAQKCSVTGINERYDDVCHIRNLEYNKSSQMIKVKDEILSNNQHDYKLLWHLASDIQAIIRGQGQIALFRNNTYVMEVKIICDVEFSLIKVRGQIDPFLLGWHCKKFEHKEPINTLVFECKGQCVTVHTNFIITDN